MLTDERTTNLRDFALKDDLEYRDLIYRTKRRTRDDGLSPEERIALNIFWRDGVKVPVLARAFRVAKNTIYYKALTGDADSYPNSSLHSNSAKETNDLVDEMGVEKARRLYVTDKMARDVKAELRLEAERRAQQHARRRA